MFEPFNGLLAEFDSPSEVLAAAQALTKAGYKKIDVHTPFPIHGMNKALKLNDSPIGFVVLIVGILAFVAAFFFQYWAGAISYPVNVSGKPAFSYPSYVCITYGFMTIVTSITAALTMFALNSLPQLYYSLFKSENFAKFSTDGFFISISSTDKKFDREKTAKLVEELNGKSIEYVED